MNSSNKADDPRRRLLIEALTLGFVSAGFPASSTLAQAFGPKPPQMPPEQSIFRITGTATVNGQAATLQTAVRPGDIVETGKASEIIFAVGGHSMLLRENSRLEIEGARTQSSMLINGLRMLTGKMMSVSRNANFRVTTSTATIGIRGTGWYAESDPEQTYFCTCYGSTDIAAINDPASTEQVNSKHHDRPLYILAKGRGRMIRSAPVINHADQELWLIEAIVGRAMPFDYNKAEPAPPPPFPAY